MAGSTQVATPRYRLPRAKLYFGRVAERDPERANGEGAGAPRSNGGTSDDMSDWVEDEETFTEDAEFFHYTDDLEEVEEDEEGEGELVETVDEFGRRHLRRAAPEGTEQIRENEAPRRSGLPDSIERWRQRSATGAVLTAFAFGLQNVFEPERKEPAIIMQTSGRPAQGPAGRSPARTAGAPAEHGYCASVAAGRRRPGG